MNGQAVSAATNRGYLTVTRTWRAGDVIDLWLPMPVRRVAAHPKVEADRGRVALQRGPIVFAAEWPDNPGHTVRNLVLPDGAALSSVFRPGLLGGVQVVTARGVALARDAQGRVTRRAHEVAAIPYFAWANRGPGQMVVWLPTTEAGARPTPWATLTTTARVTASVERNTLPIHDGEEPRASSDDTAFFGFWPRRGTVEWVEYAFDGPATVSRSSVYWFDDGDEGRTGVPASWRLLYREDGRWLPVETRDAYGVAKDTYNQVAFTPVTTTGLRLEIILRPEFSAGIQEWDVR